MATIYGPLPINKWEFWAQIALHIWVNNRRHSICGCKGSKVLCWEVVLLSNSIIAPPGTCARVEEVGYTLWGLITLTSRKICCGQGLRGHQVQPPWEGGLPFMTLLGLYGCFSCGLLIKGKYLQARLNHIQGWYSYYMIAKSMCDVPRGT